MLISQLLAVVSPSPQCVTHMSSVSASMSGIREKARDKGTIGAMDIGEEEVAM